MFSHWLKNNTEPGQLIDLNYYLPLAINQSVPGISYYHLSPAGSNQIVTHFRVDGQDFSDNTYQFRYNNTNTPNGNGWLYFDDCSFINTTLENSLLQGVAFTSRRIYEGGQSTTYFTFRNTTFTM